MPQSEAAGQRLAFAWRLFQGSGKWETGWCKHTLVRYLTFMLCQFKIGHGKGIPICLAGQPKGQGLVWLTTKPASIIVRIPT